MGRINYPVIALVAGFVCVASFAVSYSNFDGYGDLDPEQNSLQVIESGNSFTIVLEEDDQIWAYSEDGGLTESDVGITLDGVVVNGTSAKWYDTFLTSEDGKRVFVPLTKLGPGAEGEYTFDNNGDADLLYLIDMVDMGESLWNQSSVQIMAASCCLAPLFVLIGIIGLFRSSKSTKKAPKILIFDSNVGIPTTEEVFNSVNNISNEKGVDASTPDPWKEDSSEVKRPVKETMAADGESEMNEVGDAWQSWDEG